MGMKQKEASPFFYRQGKDKEYISIMVENEDIKSQLRGASTQHLMLRLAIAPNRQEAAIIRKEIELRRGSSLYRGEYSKRGGGSLWQYLTR